MARKPSKKRVDWPAAELEFVNGDGSLQGLADRLEVPGATVRAYAYRHGWQQKRSDVQQKVTTAAQASLTKSRADELAEFNSTDLMVARALRGQVVARLLLAKDTKTVLPAIELKALAGVSEMSQRIGRVALGAANETPPPPDGDAAARIRRQTAEMDEVTGGAPAAVD